MSRSGNCYENAVTESFFGTLKGEGVERTSCHTRGEARQTIFEYGECFYTRVRRHSTLASVSPVASEQVMCYPEGFGVPQKRVNLNRKSRYAFFLSKSLDTPLIS